MSGTIVIEEGVSLIEQAAAGESSWVLGSMIGDYITTIGTGMSSVFGGGSGSSSSSSGSSSGSLGHGIGQGGNLTGINNIIDALKEEEAAEEAERKKRQKKVLEAAEYAQKLAKLVFLSSELNFTDEKASFSGIDFELDPVTVENIGINFIEAISDLNLTGENMVNILGDRSVMEGTLSILLFNLSALQIRQLGVRELSFFHINPITQLLKSNKEKQDAIRKAFQNAKNPVVRGPNTAAIQNIIDNIETGSDNGVSGGSPTGMGGGGTEGEWTPPNSGNSRWNIRDIFSWGLRFRNRRTQNIPIRELTNITRESILIPPPRRGPPDGGPPGPPGGPPGDGRVATTTHF